jgi:hypothetical protein
MAGTKEKRQRRAAQETARQAYQRLTAEVADQMARLQAVIGQHDADGRPVHWGHVGDMGHIAEQLDNILAGFGEE